MLNDKISELSRQKIIDELILIGHVPGKGNFRSFFQRVCPKLSESTLAKIERHCDSFNDWKSDLEKFTKVGIFQLPDQDFLHFCAEYVNPVFERSRWDDKLGEWIDLQLDCVNAINRYLGDCGYELRPSPHTSGKIKYEYIELTGVKGKVNCIVFAATMKPDIQLLIF